MVLFVMNEYRMMRVRRMMFEIGKFVFLCFVVKSYLVMRMMVEISMIFVMFIYSGVMLVFMWCWMWWVWIF